MFCPKCGTQNPDNGKFCRSCGIDLGNVTDALAQPARQTTGFGMIEPIQPIQLSKWDARKHRSNDPHELYADGVKSIVSGIGFVIISMVLLFTGVAGGRAWWWAMLFPAFTFLAKGISYCVKSKSMTQPSLPGASSGQQTLPSAPTVWAAPESSYKTGDLVPPSVTDNTTRHLEVDKEGQTMSLPKK